MGKALFFCECPSFGYLSKWTNQEVISRESSFKISALVEQRSGYLNKSFRNSQTRFGNFEIKSYRVCYGYMFGVPVAPLG